MLDNPKKNARSPHCSFSLDRLEENLIAVFLGLMTIITFANVIARYVFNDNLLWALQTTVFLFAWMVLLGAGYCVKKSLHLGVDILIERLPARSKKPIAFLAVLVCLVFSVLLLKGSWDYWYPFATTRAFLEVDDIPMPELFQFISTWMNDGERYEKIPRFIPYSVLPIAMALMTWRFVEAGWKIYRGELSALIASHDAETEK
jgi:C4-dicarboxylate transporter DctQ subunit